jgi:hypothetical protein
MRFGVPPGCVVVGVDGSDDSDRAGTWPAQRALPERRVLLADQPRIEVHTTVAVVPEPHRREEER